MKQGTAEQSQEVRRKLRVVQMLFIGVVPVAMVFMINGVTYLSSTVLPNAGPAATVGPLLLPSVIGLGGFVFFVRSYLRCPVCQQRLKKASKGKYCAHCDTSFDVEQPETTRMPNVGRGILALLIGVLGVAGFITFGLGAPSVDQLVEVRGAVKDYVVADAEKENPTLILRIYDAASAARNPPLRRVWTDVITEQQARQLFGDRPALISVFVFPESTHRPIHDAVKAYGLKVNGHVLRTPQEALAREGRAGTFMLILGLAAAIFGVAQLRRAWSAVRSS